MTVHEIAIPYFWDALPLHLQSWGALVSSPHLPLPMDIEYFIASLG